MQPLLLLSYGTPESYDEIVPFLHNLFAGKDVPAERITAAVLKYEQYVAATGHFSPLNGECRKLIEGIQQIEPALPVYWGNLFGHPLLTDTVAKMERDKVERAVCFATSAFDSPSGNKRYADALNSARQIVGINAPILEKLPLPFDHPLFIEVQAERLLLTDSADSPAPRILFSAHSIPIVDAAQSHYVGQLQSTCRRVMERSGITFPWELVFQSRSGPPDYWLGPDIKECIRNLAAKGVESIVVSPVGFFCENMETEYDLDIEVDGCCRELGIKFFRAKTVGADPKICRMIVDSCLLMNRCPPLAQ